MVTFVFSDIRDTDCVRHSEDCLQCAAVPSKQGATFRCHTMRCGAIQTRGNFPLPFNALRCHPNKGQLSVAVQRAAVPFRQGATFRCHSMRCSAVQTRGDCPLPCSSAQARSNFPSNLKLCISRVGSVLVEQWSFAKIVFENFY